MEEEKKKADFEHKITGKTSEELDDVFEMAENEATEKVEACLFISGKFLTKEELSRLTEVSEIMLIKILKDLERKYSRGVLRMVCRNNAYKMDVSPKYHYLVNRLATGTTEFSKAEQETLAVIAYKQPVKQSVVIKIRGNKAYEHIKTFENMGLLKIKKMGHTNELSLSEEFYEYFNVEKKD